MLKLLTASVLFAGAAIPTVKAVTHHSNADDYPFHKVVVPPQLYLSYVPLSSYGDAYSNGRLLNNAARLTLSTQVTIANSNWTDFDWDQTCTFFQWFTTPGFDSDDDANYTVGTHIIPSIECEYVDSGNIANTFQYFFDTFINLTYVIFDSNAQ